MATIIDSTSSHITASPWGHAAKWAAIGAVVGFVYLLVAYNVGLMTPTSFGASIVNLLLSLAIGIAVITLGLRQYRDQVNGGVLTFKEGFMWTLGYAVLGAVLGALLAYVFYSFIAPNFFDEMRVGMEAMFENMGMSDEQIEEALDAQAGSMSVSGVLTNQLLFGVIGSLVLGSIVTAVLKRQPAGY